MPLAGIREGYDEGPLLMRELDLQHAAVGHRLRGVGDDVDEAGAHLFGVDAQHDVARAAASSDLDSLALQLRLAERQHAVDQLAQIGRRRMDLDRLAVVQKGLHHVGEPAHLLLHDRDLTQEIVAAARQSAGA